MKKIGIISDTHLSLGNDLLFSKVDCEQNLLKIIDSLVTENLDYLFILGDISQDGSIESYQKIKTILSKIKCNKYVLMGNHDSANINVMLSETIIMPEFLDIDNHRFIFVSSYKGNGMDDGYIKEEELNKINKLSQNTEMSHYVLVHHHFIQTNAIIDNWIMENHINFVDCVKKNSITAVFHGHVHNSYHNKINNTQVYAAPSTCVQFALTPNLILEPSIGYQCIYLFEGRYEHKAILIKSTNEIY